MDNSSNHELVNEGSNSNKSKNQIQSLLARIKNMPAYAKYGSVGFLAAALIGLGNYFYQSSRSIYSDQAEISAPLIILSPSQPSVLEKLLVSDGEEVEANQQVAIFNDKQYVRAQTAGVIVNTYDEIGKIFAPGTPVAVMINPDDLRLVVHIAENKGLNQIAPGQQVVFTVDSFGSKKFYGQVESVAKTADSSSVVFSISDKREEKNFSVKVKFDTAAYPDLLNGMSAKAWIYK